MSQTARETFAHDPEIRAVEGSGHHCAGAASNARPYSSTLRWGVPVRGSNSKACIRILPDCDITGVCDHRTIGRPWQGIVDRVTNVSSGGEAHGAGHVETFRNHAAADELLADTLATLRLDLLRYLRVRGYDDHLIEDAVQEALLAI